MKKLLLAVCLLATLPAFAADKLTITKAGPVGELAELSEANEVRVVFSEPMIVLGKIPKVVQAPFFHIAPDVKGSFRWSGTTTLIFTPDPKTPLPFATKYDVTIDPTATAVSGHKLDKQYAFSFTTPTIQLKVVDWYRNGERIDASVVIALTFNQPVDNATLAPHLQLRYAPHEWKEPAMPATGDPAYAAKVAKSKELAAATGPVFSFFPTEWDKKRFKPSPDRVVIETKPGVPADAHLEVLLDGELAKGAQSVATGKQQQYTIELEPALYIEKIGCVEKCNPEYGNRIELRTREGVAFEEMRKATSLTDVTDPAHPRAVPSAPEKQDWDSPTQSFSLDELGFKIDPAHTYKLRIDPSLTASDGQKLGYAWTQTLEYWHTGAFTSFGDGHGVWESTGGPLLPFYARNFKSVRQWLAPVSIEELMPTIAAFDTGGFQKTPPKAPAIERKLTPIADKIQSFGMDISSATTNGKGLVWVAMQENETIPKAARYDDEAKPKSTLVQVTNLGLSVKDSPLNTLILVTRLDDAKPVAGAKVAIRDLNNKVVWSGTTDATGIAIAPNTDLRAVARKREKPADDEEDDEIDYSSYSALRFIVTAEKDGDVAYLTNEWNEGITPWDFDLFYDLNERQGLLRGTVFTDRGVYKLGEEVHLKAVLRTDTPAGVQLLPQTANVTVVIRDSHDKELDRRTLTLNEWSSSEWTFKVPGDGALGTYRVMARVPGQRLRVYGDFLVAAYRRPEFRVDTKLTAASPIAGAKVTGVISGRYLFGSAMSSRPVKWTFTKEPVYEVPSAISQRFLEEQWTFLGEDWDKRRSNTTVASKEQKLDAKGDLKLTLETQPDPSPWTYELEGQVTDVSRQQIAGRASVVIHPAPWYIGVKTPPCFADAKAGVDTALVAAGLDGNAVAGVKIAVALHRIQWNSVRHSEGNGFYTWDTERKEVPAGEWTVTSAAQPVPLHVPIGDGGEYVLVATAKDDAGHSTMTRAWFYAEGEGYTAWARYDHNRIDLTPERKTYKPGDTARILVKSPWEHATALLTTEREGVRTWKRFELTSTQQTVTVPVTEKDIPNLFVSVLLIKGRTKEPGGNDEGDPGKPSFRLGYTSIDVEDAAKRLKVEVKSNQTEYKPGTKAKIDVSVRDAKGQASRSEVTLWAVDYGVLSLTGYKTPDVLDSIYLHKALQVFTEDSRQKIISRRVLTPKGVTDGGGGGSDPGPGTIRKDFRVLAFWLGSLVTDKNGRATTQVTLPESLTTYRIMAVAGDKASRFGWGQNEIRINKPVLLTPTFPRFLALGDQATFGSVVHSQLKAGGKATVTAKSLDPSVVELTNATQTIDVPAGGNIEARFNATAKSLGTARIQTTVTLNGESDAYEEVVPVRSLLPADTVAAYGEAKTQARETLDVPKDSIPSIGGLHVELASTQMVGLAEGAEYLVTYPYGCAEQRSSAALGLMLAADLGNAFQVPGIDAPRAKSATQDTIYQLAKYQCGDGGFVFWAGDCDGPSSPYLTSWVLHVLQRAQKLKYDVSKDMLDRAYKNLETRMSEKRPTNEAYWPSYTAWQAFAVKTLVEGGRNQDSNINRLYGYVDRMPLFGIAYLADALIAKGDRGPRYAELHRRLTNAIAPEAGSAHVEELKDDYLLWLWSSNTRSTAIVLGTLVRGGEDEQLVKQMVRWLMLARDKGRWGNTQENAWAMESLVDYYRKYESEVPDFTAVVTLGSDRIANDAFRGRTTEAKSHDVPMTTLLGAPSNAPVVFDRQGSAGTLFYTMRLRYSSPSLMNEPRDQGFNVERQYAVQGAKGESKSFKAGDLIKVTLKIRNTKERRFVAVSDPIPAGTEPVESWFATTSTELVEAQRKLEEKSTSGWMWWTRSGFDHVERHDDRVDLFATRLSAGPHEFSYLVRATTSGTFTAAPLRAEEMYSPEIFGRTAADKVEVK